VSGTGLTEADTAALTKALDDLAPLEQRLFLFGGREATQIARLAPDIRGRLAPPSPESLTAEATRLVVVMPIIESRRRSAEEFERGRAAVAAATMAARDAMHDQQRAKVEAVRARKAEQQRAAAQAVTEALGE
jgi:hypothetical protein